MVTSYASEGARGGEGVYALCIIYFTILHLFRPHPSLLAAQFMAVRPGITKAGKVYNFFLTAQQEMRLRMGRKIDTARLTTVLLASRRHAHAREAAHIGLFRAIRLHTLHLLDAPPRNVLCP